MANVVKGNLEIMNEAVKRIKTAGNKKKARALIKLYKDRKVGNSKTILNQLLDFVAYEGKTAKQKETIDKKHTKLFEQYKNAPTVSETQRKAKKENKAARKIQKFVNSRVKLEANIIDTAFNKKFIHVEVKARGNGEMMVGDLEANLAKAYLLAKRKLSQKWEDFKVYGSLRYDLSATDEEGSSTKSIHHTRGSYPKAELGKFFAEFRDYFAIGEYGVRLDINSLRLQFHVVQIPTGKGGGATTDRNLESVYNKRSVLKIVNNDNNCFWYAMACLTNPGNKTASYHYYYYYYYYYYDYHYRKCYY